MGSPGVFKKAVPYEWGATLFLLTLVSILWACDTGGSSGGGSSEEDVSDLIERCNLIYSAYGFCSTECSRGGLCLEGCVKNFFPDFLECCEDFEGETQCFRDCLALADDCFGQCGPLEHDLRRECFDDFATCENACPPPIAQKDSLSEEE